MTFKEFMKNLDLVKKSIKERCGNDAKPVNIEFWHKEKLFEIKEISHFHVVPDVIIHLKAIKDK